MGNAATKVGIIGCGKISGIYLENGKKFDGIEVAAVADIDMARAHEQAALYGVPKACTVDELLADPELTIVINLTIPAAHAAVARQTLQAGKSVYNEKPLSVSRNDAQGLLELAASKELRVGCAPDTFLGAGLQTCRQLIDQGAIGTPVAATAFMLSHGPENWHPNPDFYYQPGAGPMFDMGPYYLTALVSLLGPVQRVAGSTRASFATRTVTSQPLYGHEIAVNVPTHVAGVLDFASGPIATIVTSFDIWSHNAPRLEIYGSEGTLSLPDPNNFGGPVQVRAAGAAEWQDMPLTHGNAVNSRALGVLDMAEGIAHRRPHRASGELAFHVLDVMIGVHEASASGQYVTPQSTCSRPAMLQPGLADGVIGD